MNRRVLLSENMLKQRVEELAAEIEKDFKGQEIFVVGVLTGAFIFVADLARALYRRGLTNIHIDFVRTSSYIDETEESRCTPKVIVDLKRDITGKNVLIVEDVADTGHTLHLIQNYLKAEDPKEMKTVALLNKPSKREVEINLDYVGFTVEGWIEGYGLDSIRACPEVMVCE